MHLAWNGVLLLVKDNMEVCLACSSLVVCLVSIVITAGGNVSGLKGSII